MYVRIYRRLPARLRHLALLGLAHRLLGNSPYTLRSRLLGNSPITPPSRPLRALPPSPAICLPTWTLSMLSHGPPLMWVENNDENYKKQLIDSLRSFWGDQLSAAAKRGCMGGDKKHHCTVSKNWMKRVISIQSLEVSEEEENTFCLTKTWKWKTTWWKKVGILKTFNLH